MQHANDNLQFGQKSSQDFGSYSAPAQNKKSSDGSQSLEISVPSKILASPMVQNAYRSFGLEGLKSILLQELLQLDIMEIETELVQLSQGARESQTVKRAMRATKLLAAQWMEDAKRNADIREKCQLIFETIPTFATERLQLRQELAQQQFTLPPLYPPVPPKPQLLSVENTIPLERGSSVVFLTDIQGHYDKFEMLLTTCQLAHKRGNYLHWQAPENVYVTLIGDLLNKSPYSTWGDAVGMDAFRLLEVVRRMIDEANGRLLVSLGTYDLEVATKALFNHPISGFTGKELGVNAQAQTLPLVLSFIKGTAFEEENHPYSAWKRCISPNGSLCFQPHPRFQINGEPQLRIPADPEGEPDITALIDFYERLYAFVAPPSISDRPKDIMFVDHRANQLLPRETDELDLRSLATSAGRRAHVEGLLTGSGTIDFLRKNIAGVHIFQTEQRELFAAHFDMREETLDMLETLKDSDDWEVPELAHFISQSPTLKKRRISPDYLLDALHRMHIFRLNDWLALPENIFYQYLIQKKCLDIFVPKMIPFRDRKGFLVDYRKLRAELMAEDPRGLVGYAINRHGLPRKGEPVMEKAGSLNERAKKAYCKKFLLDVFQEDLPFGVKMFEGGELIAQFPADSEQPEFLVSLLIDECASIYKDPVGVVHIPIKHAAWVEYH